MNLVLSFLLAIWEGNGPWVQGEKVFPPSSTIPVPWGELPGTPDLSQEGTALKEVGEGVRGHTAGQPGLLRGVCITSPFRKCSEGPWYP